MTATANSTDSTAATPSSGGHTPAIDEPLTIAPKGPPIRPPRDLATRCFEALKFKDSIQFRNEVCELVLNYSNSRNFGNLVASQAIVVFAEALYEQLEPTFDIANRLAQADNAVGLLGDVVSLMMSTRDVLKHNGGEEDSGLRMVVCAALEKSGWLCERAQQALGDSASFCGGRFDEWTGVADVAPGGRS